MSSPRITDEGVVYLPDSGERAPLSVVWTTLPGISFIFPVIGHVGIADSKGVTFDFSGPYQVTVGSLMGGPAKRTWKLDATKICNMKGKQAMTEAYDAAVLEGARTYGQRFHNLFLDNCHSHVAFVLNELEYGGKSDWNQVRVFKEVWLRGRWVRRREAITVFGPLLLLLSALIGVLIYIGVSS